MNLQADAVRATLEIGDKTYNLKIGSYIIGKNSNSVTQDFQIDDDSVDVKHAGFYITPHSVKLLDFFSKNGTYIDSIKLEICKAVDIPRQTTLRFGNIECYYRENYESDSGFLVTSPSSSPKNISDFIPASPEHTQDKEISQKGINRNRSRTRKQLSSTNSSSSGNKNLESPNEISNKSRDSFLVPATQEVKTDYEHKFGNISNELKEKIATLEAEDEFYIPETQEIFEKLKPSERESNGFICINTQEFPSSFDNNSNDSDNLFCNLDNSMPIDYIDHNKDNNGVINEREAENNEIRNDENEKLDNNLNKNITEEDDVETDFEEDQDDPAVTSESNKKVSEEADVDTDFEEEHSTDKTDKVKSNIEILENKSNVNDVKTDNVKELPGPAVTSESNNKKTEEEDDDTDCEELGDLNAIIECNKLKLSTISDNENIRDKDDNLTDFEGDMSALKWNESGGSNINKNPAKVITTVKVNSTFTSNNELNKTDYDIDDLEPTQLFIKPVNAAIGSHINISPSNKENILNFDTDNLDDSDLEKTQPFHFPKNLSLKIASTSKVASTPKSTRKDDVFLVPTPIKPAQIKKLNASNDDDYDLEPTQVFVQPKSTTIPVVQDKNNSVDDNDDDLAETQVFHFKEPHHLVVARSPSPVLLDSDEEENNAEFCFQETLEVGSGPASSINTEKLARSPVPSTSSKYAKPTFKTPLTKFTLDILTPDCDFIKLPDVEKIKRAKEQFEVVTTNHKRCKLMLEGSSDDDDYVDHHNNNNDKKKPYKKQNKINTEVKDQINNKPNKATRLRRKDKISDEKEKQELLSSKPSTSKKNPPDLESFENKKSSSRKNTKNKNDEKSKSPEKIKLIKTKDSSSTSTRSLRTTRANSTQETAALQDTNTRTKDNNNIAKKNSTNDEQPRKGKTQQVHHSKNADQPKKSTSQRVQSTESNRILPNESETVGRRCTRARVKSVSSDIVEINRGKMRKDSISDLNSDDDDDDKVKTTKSKSGGTSGGDVAGKKFDMQLNNFDQMKYFKNCRVVLKKEVQIKSLDKKPSNTRKRPIDNSEESVVNKKHRERSSSSHSSEASSSAAVTRKLSRTKPLIVFTKIDSGPFEKDIRKIGGLIIDNPNECNVLITDQVCRTWKFLACMAKGVPIVSTNWLESIVKGSNQNLSTENYIIQDPESEKRFKFKLRKSLYLAQHKPIFKNFTFLLTPNTRPPPDELSRIIQCGGGKVVLDIANNLKVNQDFYVVSEKVDISLWPKIRRIVPGVRIISSEGIMLAVMQQCIHFNDHILS